MHRRTTRVAPLAVLLTLCLAATLAGPATAETPVERVWGAEKYAHKLLNCTRTGGWVTADGSCIDRGSGKHSAYRKPLRRHPGISRKVAWPWARSMVTHNVCGHAIAGKPVLSQRFQRKGFRYPTYGENVGCGWGYGSPRDVVLWVHRAFQDEKPSRGGHWRNLKNRRYKSVGIGVATRDGRTMVVFDFYGRRY